MQVIQSDKELLAVSAAAGATGVIAWLEKFTPILGFIATILGIAAVLVIIYTRIRRDRREEEAHIKEMTQKHKPKTQT